ncbi:MAG: 30S ribosomal protein S17 [Gammaproteobacteria bacterium]|nr:30S ribosomal protein S17 [Gammaproteobacteria bacterium]MDE0226825.1 30S ribosomal protein S17 [Gammaproteobacteria bacterium]MDE0450561.1 30S ribosomal protein S17 [Gammaproteobacteria bacterium]
MPARSSGRTNPRTLSGTVVSDRMDKTISVLVERSVKHPVYGKIVRRKSRIHAHDEHNECKVGDFVTIVESRPISKRKSWRLQGNGTREESPET